MIDIHSHIVFDVDDGPKIELRARLSRGSSRIRSSVPLFQPHRRKGMFETPEDKIAANFSEVKQLAQEIAPDLRCRTELRFIFQAMLLEKLEQNIIPKLNGSRYALIEFSMNTPYRDIHSALTKVLMLGDYTCGCSY